VPATPPPLTATTLVATHVAAAASRSATATGCTEPCSSVEASARHCSAPVGPSVATSTSCARPVVNVPVLSRTTCVTRESTSIASARTARICLRPSDPAAAASAAGVANDNAHGHETTNTANVTISAREASICHQIRTAPAATTSTPTT